ncbi:hypothetical protein VO54_01925 [Elizabethkingia miricola]|nr:hypothetical protein VO54_01925 [Elizabethkingia miricola]
MKKKLLITIIGITGLISTKATIPQNALEKINEIEVMLEHNMSKFQQCTVYVTFYNSDGYITGYHYFSANFDTYAMCQTYQNNIIKMLQIMGYEVAK